MPIGRRKEQQLDPKECFDLWLERGSLSKAATYMSEVLGKKNEKTGNPFSLSGIRFAALRWMIKHPETSRERILAIDPDSPWAESDDEWYLFLAKRARDAYYNYSTDKLYRWAEEYDVPEKYVDIALE